MSYELRVQRLVASAVGEFLRCRVPPTFRFRSASPRVKRERGSAGHQLFPGRLSELGLGLGLSMVILSPLNVCLPDSMSLYAYIDLNLVENVS